jgi:hypothetical protein
MADTRTRVFRASLNPKIHRELEILSGKKLYDPAGAIVRVFGFDFDHPFGFYSNLKGNILKSPVKYELFADMGEDDFAEPGEPKAGSVERTRIADVFGEIGAKMTFLFDYGDDWQFHLEVIGIGRKEAGIKYPRLVKSVGKAPVQYPDPDAEEDGEE